MDSVLQRSAGDQTPSQLDEILIADHQALEATFRRLMAKLAGGDPDAIRACWCSLDSELEAHLQAEEKYILPRFANQFPAEAALIRNEHAQIRSTLLQLGVDLDLHSLREETAAQFISTLRRHAKAEELMFYRWARTHVPRAERHAVIEGLRAVHHALHPHDSSARDHGWR